MKKNKYPVKDLTNFEWHAENYDNPPPCEGDVREMMVRVKVHLKWSDKIVDDFDPETGKVLSYCSGWIVTPTPQTLIFREGTLPDSQFLFNSLEEK